MVYDVHGTAKVVVTVTVEAETEEEAIEKATEEFGGLYGFVGNGGIDKLVGVNGLNEHIYADEEPEFDDVTEH